MHAYLINSVFNFTEESCSRCEGFRNERDCARRKKSNSGKINLNIKNEKRRLSTNKPGTAEKLGKREGRTKKLATIVRES